MLVKGKASFTCFSFSPSENKLEKVVEILKSSPYKSLAQTKAVFVNTSYCGPDGVVDEQNYLSTERFLFYAVVNQERVVNKDLLKKEIEKIIQEEYNGVNLSKEDIEFIENEALRSIAHRLPVKTTTVLCGIDFEYNRFFVFDTSMNAHNYANAISRKCVFKGMRLDTPFSIGLMESVNLKTLHLGLCLWIVNEALANPTKLEADSIKLSHKSRSLELRGERGEILNQWKSETAPELKALSISILRKIAETGDKEQDFEAGWSFKLTPGKLGFYDVCLPKYRGADVGGFVIMMGHIEEVLSQFQNLVFQYEKCILNQKPEEVLGFLNKRIADVV